MNEKEVLFKVISTNAREINDFLQKLSFEWELTEKEKSLKEMFSLRHNVYIEKLSWVEKNEFSQFNIEVDEFDKNNDAIHIGLDEGDGIVSYIRLLKEPFMINEVSDFSKITTYKPLKNELEGTRLCVSSEADLTVFPKLLSGLITVCTIEDVELIVGLLESSVRVTAFRKGLPIDNTLGKGGINNLPVEVVSFSMSEDNLENIKSKNSKSLKDINSFKFEFFMDECVKFLSFKEIWQNIKKRKIIS